MNVFVLDETPEIAAQMHCDKHVVKMIVETAQMLSTAHRVLDGNLYFEYSRNHRKLKRYRLHDEKEDFLYKAAFINHPCNIWVRKNTANYFWTLKLLTSLIDEYHFRFNKSHKTENLLPYLLNAPSKLLSGNLSYFVLAMPNYCKIKNNAVASYRNYYLKEKSYVLNYTRRKKPEWVFM